MADYISRDKAAKVLCMARGNAACDPFECSFYKEMEDILAADVRPVAEISDSVEEALCFLNSFSNEMPYHVYSALFDLIAGIYPNCGADMREVDP